MKVTALERLLTLLELLLRVLLLCIVAEDCLVDHGVVNLLLPPVILGAARLQGTPLLILANEVASLPFFADLKRIVLEQMRLPPEILPIVRINTLRLIVLVVEGAPLSFEIEHEKLLVARHLVNERRLDICVRMRKRTELLVLAASRRLSAELGLVLLNMVQAFDFVVDVLAVQIGAVFERAKVNAIIVHCGAATLVQLPVVVRTIFRVVRLSRLAFDHFESFQVQVLPALLVCLE